MESRTRVAGMIIKDGKLLMLKGRGYEELWTPGGKIEPDETDEQCLRRELEEELHVELTDSKFFKEYSGPSYYIPNKITIQRIYIASIRGTPKPDAEIEGLVWMNKADFKKKKYRMIPITEDEIIPDLIKEGIF